MTIEEREQEIIDEFALFDDQMERYEYIIDIGKKLAPLDAQYMTDDYLVKGCQSKVWLHAYMQEGRLYFEADSNSTITKGIIALLVRVLSGQKPSDILSAPLHFIDAINLRSHLSSQRSNGLTSMIARIKAYAGAYTA
jgi:cysteine desulfuration protein SufE